jgi:choline dehydrogenase
VLDLPAVGKHLQDHVAWDIYYRSRVPTLNQQLNSWVGKALAGMRYLLTAPARCRPVPLMQAAS